MNKWQKLKGEIVREIAYEKNARQEAALRWVLVRMEAIEENEACATCRNAIDSGAKLYCDCEGNNG